MKKHFIILFFTLIIISAYTAETWLSAEYQYGVSFFKGEDIDSYSSPESKHFNIGHSGINIKTYTFWKNQNIGLFTKAGLMLPYFNRNDNENDYMQYGGIPLSLGTGIGFRHILSGKSNIHYAVGLGFDFSMFFSKYKFSYSLVDVQEYNQKLYLSLLFDIGYKYNINDNLYINTGANLNFGFAKHIKKSSKSDLHNNNISKWAKGFFSFEFLPYIGVGVIINSK
ncbi:hypothetical protein [Treponema putidum]|uniref:hypothetical protein n=1 Tax=Treponema putidum TaxID=221027 RepID=UPI003D907A3E